MQKVEVTSFIIFAICLLDVLQNIVSPGIDYDEITILMHPTITRQTAIDNFKFAIGISPS